jgi:hypothetical protein
MISHTPQAIKEKRGDMENLKFVIHQGIIREANESLTEQVLLAWSRISND